MYQSALKAIRIVLILAGAGLVLWLVNMNIPHSGMLEINAVLGSDLPIISRLGPDNRLRAEDGYQAVFENQVYFDLRVIPWFKEAVIYLEYQEDGRKLNEIAGKVGKDWNYYVEKPITIANSDSGFLTAVFKFDLSKLYKPKNMARFLISTSPDREGGELKVKSLKILLKR